MTNDLTIKPNYLQEYEQEGVEDISSNIVDKSFLKIAHSSKGGLKEGHFYDSITNESFGTEVSVTICKIEQNWKKFNRTQFEAYSKDGITWDNGERLTEDEKWQTAFIDIFVILNDNPGMPYIKSFKSTSYKTGKKLITMLAKFTKCNKEPIFARSFTLSTQEESHKNEKWFTTNYKLNEGFNSKTILKIASDARKMLSTVNLSEEFQKQNDLDDSNEVGELD